MTAGTWLAYAIIVLFLLLVLVVVLRTVTLAGLLLLSPVQRLVAWARRGGPD